MYLLHSALHYNFVTNIIKQIYKTRKSTVHLYILSLIYIFIILPVLKIKFTKKIKTKTGQGFFT